jgi:hypothetical protein
VEHEPFLVLALEVVHDLQVLRVWGLWSVEQ